jgi:hypothetical protein
MHPHTKKKKKRSRGDNSSRPPHFAQARGDFMGGLFVFKTTLMIITEGNIVEDAQSYLQIVSSTSALSGFMRRDEEEKTSRKKSGATNGALRR